MKIFKIAYQIFSWITVAAILSVASVLILSKINTPIGLRAFSILSGSMEPTIPTGSMVITRSLDEYQIGDVLTVMPNGPEKVAVTHRLVGFEEQADTGLVGLRLKGDANEEDDRNLIREERVIGKVIFHVPFVGRVIEFSQTEVGFFSMIVIPAIVLIYNEIMVLKKEIPAFVAQLRKKRTRKKEDIDRLDTLKTEDAPAVSS